MSRYSSYTSNGAGSTSYRSPYLDSSYSSSNYSSYPAYESKFESIISRNPEGTARSRAGTSTKYDYLSSYASSGASSVASKYDRTPSYSTKSNYASVIDTDDLTRSYFEKYYNKSSTSAINTNGLSHALSVLDSNSSSTPSRSSRAYSVYLDEDRQNTNTRASIVPETRTIRSSSVAVEPVSPRATEAVRSRFSRTLSIYDDTDTKNDISQVSNGTKEEDPKEYKYTSGYVRFSQRKKEKEKEESPPASVSSYRRGRDTSPYSVKTDREKSPSSSITQRTYGGRSNYSNGDDDSNPRFGSNSRYASNNGREKEESPQADSSSSGAGGASGLRNIGNTCFMNSVIQCLSNTKLLTNYLLNDEHVRDINTSNSSMKGSLIKAFATVIKGLWKGNGRVVDPSSLKGAVQRFAPRFSGYNQEDSQEFLRYLLEGLHEDVNRVITKPQPIHTEIDSSLSVCEQAMEAWKRYIRRDDSHLVDLFVGQLKSTLRCSDCNHESVTFEAFWDLSLGIPSKTGEVSLLDCLDTFTKEEVLDGDEMPTCERCKTRRKSTKRYTLYRLPKILVVHLKRFSPSERSRNKLSTTVTFPLNGLNLSRYTDSVSNSSYNCYAISNHSGTLYSGHYTAYAKHAQSGQWHSYNDSRVSKCSSSNVISNEAYLLFFELS
eukprot:TRINITY_DN15097_c1_g1_i1.p1 TRINITY_DN15097_c1_g1~~TRINITY_DN15097_c1_g1_i1.p1  ORF type:complete len:660 (-),score=107.70 TRINITY_DN15097_c1_g1_i1:1496-3475(-)